MTEPSASEQIDAIIANAPDWRGDMLAHLRAVILAAGADVTEEVKWKKPSKPEGVATWTHNGNNICIGEMLKNAVRLTFPKGALVDDPTGIFNTRLDSKLTRAVDFSEGDKIDKPTLQSLIYQATKLNPTKWS